MIGTFAVLLAMGYSANTVSLLAMVLAIGIVVDDAIVVVENVERVMEEEPELSPAAATKKAMGQITAPIIAITLVLLSVFVPLAFIPGISGELFRQFAVTISASMLLSAINSLTLSPALCGVLLRHTGAKRGIMAWVSRRIDNVRDGYAAIVGKTLRLSILSLALIAAFGGGDLASRPADADGLPAGRGSGRLLRRWCNCRMPPPSRAPMPWCEQVEEILRGMPQVQDVASVVGYSFLDSFSPSNSAFVIATLKPFEDRKAAADSAQALIGQDLRRGPADSWRRCAALQPATGDRPIHHRRLRIHAGEPAGRRPGHPRQHDARSHRSRQCGPATGARVLDLHRRRRLPFTSISIAPRRRRLVSTSAMCSTSCSRRSAAIT